MLIIRWEGRGHVYVEGLSPKNQYHKLMYAIGRTRPNYPVPSIIYTPVLECATIWEYKGYPDDIRSSYPTY